MRKGNGELLLFVLLSVFCRLLNRQTLEKERWEEQAERQAEMIRNAVAESLESYLSRNLRPMMLEVVNSNIREAVTPHALQNANESAENVAVVEEFGVVSMDKDVLY